jgi:cytoskeleton protein RodZ
VLVDRASFCARLRAARESKGLPLQQIAASTKISAALLRGLEAADLSRWPKGLFRRSYVRDYLRAVGLPVEPTIAEFLHLFPDGDDQPITGHHQSGEDETPRLSLTLGTDRTERAAKAKRHLVAAVVDIGVVVAVSVAAASWIPADFGRSLAWIALVYYSAATASVGRSFGAQWVLYRSSARWRKAAVADAPPDSLFEKIRRIRELSVPSRRAAARDIVRVPWNAILLRLRFLR